MAAATHANQISKSLQSCRDTDVLLQKLRGQFDQGIQDARLAWKDIQGLAADSLNHLRQRVEADLMTQVRVEFDHTPGVSPGMIFKADAPEPKSPAKTARKIARPRNAFILYRGDWHSETVLQNPGMHNNQISKIIGNRWRFEDQAVKQRYKELAEEEKRQHAIDHPGYQYQPRKPHEKKKRMTKKKFAAITEKKDQQVLAEAYDPVKVQLKLPDATLNFEANFDPDHALEAQIEHWNKTAGHQPPQDPLPIDMYTTCTYNGVPDMLPADGVSADDYIEYDLIVQEDQRSKYIWDDGHSAFSFNAVGGSGNNMVTNPVMSSTNAAFSAFHNQTAVLRGINTLFDFDAYDQVDTSADGDTSAADNVAGQV